MRSPTPEVVRRVAGRLLIAALFLGCAAFPFGGPAAAASQPLTTKQGAPAGSDATSQSLLKADSLIYDRDRNTVTASGHVQIYNQGRVLQADKVIYDRAHDRVYASGHAKLTESDGSVAYGERFELTQDLKSGFIDAVRSVTSGQAYFTAARAERSQGRTTVLQRGAYTACEPCKQHPERPPTWEVRAKRIVHDSVNKTIYYEDAELEFYGVPLIYLPYFSTPDPSVKRKSGVLAPTYTIKPQLGFGVSVPYFFNLAPNYDLTVTPTYYSRQGPALALEWRHRLANGSYDIAASGVYQEDPGAFSPQPYGAGSNLRFRGALRSDGQFYINPNWRFGWDVSLATDKYYTQDYGSTNQNLTSSFFGVNTSTAYLTGQGAQSYFDLRGYYFQALAPNVLQAQEPIAAPVLNYDRAFEIDPATSHGIGGQVELDASFTHVDQLLADYQSIGKQSLDQAFDLYSVCETNRVPTYTPGFCSLRGVAGDYNNATVNASWQRKYIDSLGDVWTPFAFAHLSGTYLNLDSDNSQTFSSPAGSSTISNASQSALLGVPNQTFVGEAVPGAGMEWRYPLIDRTSWGTMILEPIAQIVGRPSESPSAAQINVDSQSLVFDDTNLFDWNRFSGDDRFEGGTRANYGAQYSMLFDNGGYANVMVGQSYQLAGVNSYATQDALAVGLLSGLDTRASDYVTRVQYSPSSNFTFIAKDDFEPTTFSSQRLDLMGNATFGRFEGSLDYARYIAQPSIGYYVTREGLSPSLKLHLSKDVFVDGDVVFDLSRHFYNQEFNADAPLFSIAGLGVGAGYSNDCATLAVNYTSVYQADLLGPAQRNQTVTVSLQLKTLGDTQIHSGLSGVKVTDGLESVR